MRSKVSAGSWLAAQALMIVAALALHTGSAAAFSIDFEAAGDGGLPLEDGYSLAGKTFTYSGVGVRFVGTGNATGNPPGSGNPPFGPAIFDTDVADSCSTSADPDLCANLGNALILQGVDGEVATTAGFEPGVRFTTPDDFNAAGSLINLIFDSPVDFSVGSSIDLIDINGLTNNPNGSTAVVIRLWNDTPDGGLTGAHRRIVVPINWTGEPGATDCGAAMNLPCDGWETLALDQGLTAQMGDGPGTPSTTPTNQDGTPDLTQVETLQVIFWSSGAVDTVVTPEPTTALMMAGGLLGLAFVGRRRF